MEEFEELKPDKKPAINISIQSWATPIVGLIMLVIGIYGGYFLRPTNSNPQVQEVVPQATTAAETARYCRSKTGNNGFFA